MKVIKKLSCAIALFCGISAAHAQGARLALVVGISAYEHVHAIANPVNDAVSVGNELQKIGFNVDLVKNATAEGFRERLARFVASITGANVALFYYAGHGVAIGGVNYLVPVDAIVNKVDDIRAQLISLNDIVTLLSSKGGRATLIILDACRNNPFEGLLVSDDVKSSRGLAEVYLDKSSIGKTVGTSSAAGTLIAFATGPGRVARDGNGEHSPFTTALLKYLLRPGIEVNLLFNDVRQDVFSATNGDQIPWSQSAMVGALYLAGEPSGSSTPSRFPPP